MAQGAHKITEQFEQELCKYTGAPYAVAIDNCSNALFLALYYELQVKTKNNAKFLIDGKELRPIITIPKHTYPSVACEIIHAGGKVQFDENYKWFDIEDDNVHGSYYLIGTNVIDASLSFTNDMYEKESHMCLSFTGPYKHLKLGKGGSILTDDKQAALWFKRARFSGRQECSYFNDNFDEQINVGDYIDIIDRYVDFKVDPVAGWNFYMMPEIAAKGLALMPQFYNYDGTPKHNDDLCLPYPDLSKFKIFNK